MRYAVATLAILLSACAVKPVQWSKYGGDQREKLECELEAEKAAFSSDPNAMVAAFEAAQRRIKVMDLCMRSKGWSQVR